MCCADATSHKGTVLLASLFLTTHSPGDCERQTGLNDHGKKIRSRKQRTDIGKYSFVNRTIQLWNQLLKDALGALSCKPSSFRKRGEKC
jgi:hypothetical protein